MTVSLFVPLALTAPGEADAADTGSFAEAELWDSTDVDAYASMHVQGLAVVPKGTVLPAGDGRALPDDVVLTFTEGRFKVGDDGPKDLLFRRSVDGGRTWSASAPVVPADDTQSWGNATPVVDAQTGRVCLFYKGSNGTIFLKRSDDAGATWSAPQELTGLFASNPHGWTRNSPIPGHGIQLRTGRLLMPVNHRAPDPDRNYGIDMLYSDDHGTTWRRSAATPVNDAYPINESRVYERSDGTVVVNGRWGAGGTRYRIMSISNDHGQTWSPPVIDGSTGQFVSVDAGMLEYSSGQVDRLLFSRPESSARENMTVSISYDEGASFRYSRVVNAGRSYYSDLARLSDGTILLVYGRDGTLEGYPERITIARFDLEWLTDGRDSLAGGPGLSRHEHELATAEARTSAGGAAPIVSDANARGGKVLRYPAPAGAYVDVPFTVAQAGGYEVAVRLHRRSDRGRISASIDGKALAHSVIDPTLTVGEGYQLYRLGTMSLTSGQHSIRFALLGPGRGGGSVIAPDQLLLTSGGSAADAPTVVADNDSLPSFEVVSGSWTKTDGGTGDYGQSYHWRPKGTGGNKVRFRPDVPMNGVYEASVWYRAGADQASNAAFVIRHAEGQSTVKVDQGSGGGRWVRLGEYVFAGGGGGTIELSDAADGTVIADAIRLSYRGAVTDNDATGFEVVSGEWNSATGVDGHYGPNYRTAPAGNGGAVARWRPEVPANGRYEIAVWYTEHTNRASNAPFIVNHANGSTTVPIDQRSRGGQWVTLGAYWLNNASTIELTNAANGYVIADAVRLVYQGIVADNDDATGYEVVSGNWNPAESVDGHFGPSYRTAPAGTGDAVVRWRLNVPTSGTYQVAVWYTEHANRASNAPYVVNGSSTVRVDQRSRGGQWVSLGSFWLDNTSTVELSNAANGYVVADAVRIIAQ